MSRPVRSAVPPHFMLIIDSCVLILALESQCKTMSDDRPDDRLDDLPDDLPDDQPDDLPDDRPLGWDLGEIHKENRWMHPSVNTLFDPD